MKFYMLYYFCDNMKEFYNKYLNERIKLDNLILIGITCLIIVISGVFGFIYEFIFYYFNGGMKDFYYRGGNFLPWINIYAIGSILIVLLTFKDRLKPIKVFLKSTIICGILEFISGYIIYNYFGHFRCWDYNREILNFGNIGGFICLRSVVFFGVSSLLLIYGIIPIVIYLSKRINKKLFITISIALCTIILLDEIYNLVIARVINTPRASDVYKEIGVKYVEFKE